MTESVPWSGREAAGIPYLVAPSLEAFPGLRHGFFGRQGGTSTGPYASLNLGLGSGDVREVVAENRLRLWQALAFPRPPLLPGQVHGTTVVQVTAENAAALQADPPRADALITALRDQPLAILTADCYPVVIVDRATPAVALVHAGWRGTVGSIVWKTLLTMFETFGTRSEDCAAAIGPGIAGPCYEVGEDVRTAFVKGLPYGQDVLAPAGEFKWWADLREANRRQLLDGRLKPSQVDACPACTHCAREQFFSARRDKLQSGRQATVVMLT